nr:hypothetical protein [Mycoplasmopsis bovis]
MLALKGFTIPVYENGSTSNPKLKVYDAPEVPKGPSPIDTIGRNIYRSNGLARTLLNETYKTIAEQTFQVSFTTLKDFEDEIKEAEKLKEDSKKWTTEQFQQFTFKDRAALKANYETNLYKLRTWNKKSISRSIKRIRTKFCWKKEETQGKLWSWRRKIGKIRQ